MRSVNERIADEIRRHAISLARYSEHEKQSIFRMLNRLFGQLRNDLQDSDITTGRTRYQRRRLELLFKQVRSTIATSYEGIGKRTEAGLKSLAEIEGEWAVSMLNKSLGVSFVTMTPATAEQLAAIASDVLIEGAPSSEWWSRQSEKLLNNFKDQIRQGWTRGETLDQLMKRLTGGLDEDGNPYFDLRKGTRRGAEATIRTSVQAVANDARMRAYKDNADIIEGLQWVSTLDMRTTVECFPGETIVAPVGSLQRVYKRRYSGEFIIITTSTGKEIVGTPNHPILTPNGWLALDKVKPNQKVCYTVLDEKFVVLGVQNIGVPTKFSELFDSVYADPISKVFYERSSTDQFHGDGMRGDEKVCVVNAGGFLGNDIKLSTMRKEVQKDSFRSGQKCSGFFSLGLLFGLVLAWLPPIPPLKIAFKFLKNNVKPRLPSLSRKLFQNVRWGNSFVKKSNGEPGVRCTQGVSSVSGGVFHNSGIDKELCSRSGGYPERLGNLVGGFPGSILCDNVVSVRSEYRSCHVYNLQSNQGLYIANGFIVKNCAALDGLVWDINGNPIGHGISLDPPPRHWNCRSVLTCITKSFREMGIPIDEFPESTRASVDGQVPESQTFEKWISGKPDRYADEVFGKGRAELWRQGKISVRDMVDQRGNPLTLEQLRKQV